MARDSYDFYYQMGEFIGAEIDKRDRRLDRLESRLAELEQRPTLKFAGVWRKGTQYEAGACVQHGGSLWLAVALTKGDAKPNASAFWRLVVKQGQLDGGAK